MENARPLYPLAFKDLSQTPDFVRMEKEILSYWRDEDTFEKSMEKRKGEGEFVFFDGPPFANGLPHYGHLLTGYAKDI